jgi:azurin
MILARFLAVLLAAASVFGSQAPAPQAPADTPPRVLYTVSPRAIEYQINRLTNAELARVERRDDDVKYRPVYVAMLTRKGLGREYFDEALAALGKMDKATPTRVLLDALSKVAPDDTETAGKMLGFLFAQPRATLQGERAAFVAAVDAASAPVVLRAAYGGVMLADDDPAAAWKMAAARAGHLGELLRAVPSLGSAPGLRAKLFEPVAAVVSGSGDAQTRASAVAALGWTRRDASTFTLLAREAAQPGDDVVRAAAVRSLRQLPADAWPADAIEPLVRSIAANVSRTPAERRNAPDVVEAIELGERLADALPDDARRALRRDLRALGVQVVRIETIPEKMAFDVKWFAVEAGRPVQIILVNPDVMSHNLLVVRPGALQDVGTLASTMTPSPDPKAKPYVPDSPLVLQATRLLNWGETERLNFTAPKAAGEYPFVCTFPGHWVRMYGVMLVVAQLEAWEAKPTVPIDPMTKKPFDSKRTM